MCLFFLSKTAISTTKLFTYNLRACLNLSNNLFMLLFGCKSVEFFEIDAGYLYKIFLVSLKNLSADRQVGYKQAPDISLNRLLIF